MKVLCTVADLEKAMKKAERREKLNRKIEDVKGWFRNNKDMILILGPAVIGAAAFGWGLGKMASYDRSLGHYWALRRELTNREWAEIDQRKKSGERLADILSEMKVLK